MRAVPWIAALAWLGLGASAPAAELKVLTWSSYLSPKVVERFEKETGVKVTLATVTNYVDLLKPLENGASGFDIAFPADFQVRDLVARGLVEKVFVDRLPNFWNVEDVWRSRALDPRNEYTVPHVWGTTAFVVDTAQYKGDPDTLDLLFAPPPEVRGSILLMDSGYDMVQLALVWLKLPRCSTKPEHLAKVEALLDPMLRRYPLADIDTVVEALASGRHAVGVAWNGDALKARQKRSSLHYAYPREGSLVWTDVLVVPKGAPNRADALRFMSFMMRPDVAAMESNYNGYANMVRGSEQYMDKELVAAPEIITPISSSLDFFTYCDNIAESRQEVFWKDLREKLGK
ncbi:MAG TPA: extracellular solute-binding protein [Magnetospirillum sp.]|nr:extracellular solute-binding protein [Magnetospirillum sp.]